MRGVAITVIALWVVSCAATQPVRPAQVGQSPPPTAQPKPAPAPQLPAWLVSRAEALASAGVDEQQIPGVALAVVHPGGDVFVERGVADSERQRLITRETVFEIGSVTKVFTGLLLAQLAQEKKVKLDDPVARFFPEDVMTGRARAITLLSLSTHRSGLPRQASNLKPNDRDNPYATYDEARLIAFLRNVRPEHDVDERYLYSNVGVGLLGRALERATGKSYAELLQVRICQPLGMRSTTVARASLDPARLAEPHDRYGKDDHFWDLGVLVGAGGIYSTTEDMVAFVHAQLRPESTPWPKAVSETQRPHRPGACRWGQRGLGWTVDGALLSHNGGTGGFRSFVAVDTEHGFGVVVLANRASDQVDLIGLTLMRELLGLPS